MTSSSNWPWNDQHFRWKKCKVNLSVLTSVGGANRPGQAGTSGQLFFTKCGDPPEGCPCVYEPKTGEPFMSLDIFEFSILPLDFSLLMLPANGLMWCVLLQCLLDSKYAIEVVNRVIYQRDYQSGRASFEISLWSFGNENVGVGNNFHVKD